MLTAINSLKSTSTATIKITNGFTLIEVVMSVFIFALIGVGVIYLTSNIFSSSAKQGQLITDSDQSRRLAKQLMNELRNAINSNTGAFSIASANEQSITFYSNLNGGAAVEKIRYYIQGDTVLKGTITPTGTPFSYNPSDEKVEIVQKDVRNGSAPLFYYYDDDYTGTTDNFLPQPVNLNKIKHVKINLIIANKAGLTDNPTFTVTDSATLRNLKDNLGN
jgi:prepilin-type N-terminal cleavage/methylation domain-containing protein